MKNESTQEKIGAFYASDYHFEMISLPYISKKMEENNQIIILTQNNLEESVKTVLSKTNLKQEKKNQILQLNWNKKEIENIDKKQKELVIFIKGDNNYIQETNKKLEPAIAKYEKVKIVECYSVEEIGENLSEVMGKYKKILGTTGEKTMQEAL